MLEWLRAQNDFPKVVWKGRDDAQFTAASGARETFTELPKDLDVPCFCAFSFCGKKNHFFIPKEIRTFSKIDTIARAYSLKERSDFPSKNGWKEQVKRALSENLEKVVLARKTSFKGEIDPLTFFSTLSKKTSRATLFYLETAPGEVFLGASPELLYKREGREIVVEAIAGTRPRGSDPGELLENPKELHEWDIVAQFINGALPPLCEAATPIGAPTIIETTNLQHLYGMFCGKLKTVDDGELIKTLHPTPAVGGFPQEKARAWIDENENFSRGNYAAPIGWISKECAELVVAIRSGLVTKSHLHLFAGTGIVDGSVPENEWRELDHKIEAFL